MTNKFLVLRLQTYKGLTVSSLKIDTLFCYMEVSMKARATKKDRVVKIEGNGGISSFPVMNGIPIAPSLLKHLRRDPKGVLANRVNMMQEIVRNGGTNVDGIKRDITQTIAYMEARGISIPDSVACTASAV